MTHPTKTSKPTNTPTVQPQHLSVALRDTLANVDALGHATSPGLLSAADLLLQLWPQPESRPSLRWIREMQAKRAIPFLKISHKVYFEIDRVRAALRRFEVSAR